MAAGDPIVEVERGDELEHTFRGLLRRVAHHPTTRFVDTGTHLSGRSVAQGESKTRRRTVREREGQVEQCGERRQPASETIRSGEDHRRRGGDHDPPGHRARDRGRHGDERAQTEGRAERGGDRTDDDPRTEAPADPRMTSPQVRAKAGSPPTSGLHHVSIANGASCLSKFWRGDGTDAAGVERP